MIDSVTIEQLEESSWSITELSYTPGRLPLPGVCRLTCVEYPVVYQFFWQILNVPSADGTRLDRCIDCTDAGDSVEIGDLTVLDNHLHNNPLDAENTAGLLGIPLRAEFPWLSEAHEKFARLLEPKDTTMETFTLEQDDGPDVRFTGERVAEASSRSHEGPQSTRWTSLDLYRTSGGKLVCHECGLTMWEGERDRHTVYFADDEKELVKTLGYGWLAKRLYDAAGIDHAQEID